MQTAVHFMPRALQRLRSLALRPSALVLTALVLVLLPSANWLLFAGMPIDTVPAILALALVVPLLVSSALRDRYAALLEARSLLGRVLLVAAVAAIFVKVGLLAGGGRDGFAACISTPESTPPRGGCEVSYDNPAKRFGATRVDRSLDFGATDGDPATSVIRNLRWMVVSGGLSASNWELGFLNTLRYNFFLERSPL